MTDEEAAKANELWDEVVQAILKSSLNLFLYNLILSDSIGPNKENTKANTK